MFDFQALLAIAYKKETVLSRRLAKNTALSCHEALIRVLQQAAGDRPLGELIAARLSAKRAAAVKRAARQQAQADALLRRQEKNRPEPSAWRAWFDGSTHPNPGKMGLGGLLQSPAGEHIEICRAAGQGDSNQAEYLALLAVLEAAVRVQPARLVVYGDSQVVIDDVTRSDGSGASGLSTYGATYRASARQLLAQLGTVELRWIPRRRNAVADALSRQAVGLVVRIAPVAMS
jgi:ribonuclease HI